MVKHLALHTLRRSLATALNRHRGADSCNQGNRGNRDDRPQPSGFTLMEPLVALVVVAVLLITTAPVIVLSVASRVRARQLELATQAARGYIDNLRGGTLDPPSTLNSIGLPPRTALVANQDFRYGGPQSSPTANTCPATSQNADGTCVSFPSPLPADFMRPTFAASDFVPPANTTTANGQDQGVLFDGNGDSKYRGVVDFRIQAIRTMVQSETAAAVADAGKVRQLGYSVIVRLYQGNADLGIPLDTREMGTPFSAATGRGSRTKNNPLIVIRTEIAGSPNASSSSNYTNNLSPKVFQP